MSLSLLSKIRSNRALVDSEVNKPQQDSTESTVDTLCILEDGKPYGAANEQDNNHHHHQDDDPSSTGSSTGLPEESMETVVVELQDEVRSKAEQLTILRDTLSTMSVKMQRMECQLQKKEQEIERLYTLVHEKTKECQEWKAQSEEASAQQQQGAAATDTNTTAHMARLQWEIRDKNRDIERLHSLVEEKTNECRDWQNKCEGGGVSSTKDTKSSNKNATQRVAAMYPDSTAEEDPLLGDFRANRPWKAQPEQNGEGDKNNDEDDDDSISNPYGSSLDASLSRSSSRSRKRRQSSRRRSKTKSHLKEFESMPMLFLTEQTKQQQGQVEQKDKKVSEVAPEATAVASASNKEVVSLEDANQQEEEEKTEERNEDAQGIGEEEEKETVKATSNVEQDLAMVSDNKAAEEHNAEELAFHEDQNGLVGTEIAGGFTAQNSEQQSVTAVVSDLEPEEHNTPEELAANEDPSSAEGREVQDDALIRTENAGDGDLYNGECLSDSGCESSLHSMQDFDEITVEEEEVVYEEYKVIEEVLDQRVEGYEHYYVEEAEVYEESDWEDVSDDEEKGKQADVDRQNEKEQPPANTTHAVATAGPVDTVQPSVDCNVSILSSETKKKKKKNRRPKTILEKKRSRVRRMARKESKRAAFTIEKVEC